MALMSKASKTPLIHFSALILPLGLVGTCMCLPVSRLILCCSLQVLPRKMVADESRLCEILKQILRPKASGNRLWCHFYAPGLRIVLGQLWGSLSSTLLHHLTCIQTASTTLTETSKPLLSHTKCHSATWYWWCSSEQYRKASLSRHFSLCIWQGILSPQSNHLTNIQ